MFNSWSKEDISHFEKSEVMQEFEKRVIENLHRLAILNKKAQAEGAAELKEVENQANETAEALKGVAEEQAKLNPADDDPEKTDETAEDGLADKSAVVEELREMIKAAMSNNNIKLAYKIERTIDEILEQSVKCEL
jgi:hypothetical protein